MDVYLAGTQGRRFLVDPYLRDEGISRGGGVEAEA